MSETATRLVMEHLVDARRMAARVAWKTGARGHRLAELTDTFYADALVGLWTAAKRFKDTHASGAKFMAYAAKSVLGEIQTQRYKKPGYSKRCRAVRAEQQKFMDVFVATEGRPPATEDYPERLQKNMRTLLDQSRTPTSLTDRIMTDGEIDELITGGQFEADGREWVQHALKLWPRRDRYIVWRYAVDGWTAMEIGEKIGMSESGVLRRLDEVLWPSLKRQLNGRLAV